MTATNHALTGATIALLLHGSIIALPLALVSHYALDSLPHYGEADNDNFLATKKFLTILAIDISFCVVFAVGLFFSQSQHWWVIIASAFLATSPDFMWFTDFLAIKKGRKSKPIKTRSFVVRLHAFVQWYQHPRGIIVEAVWFLLMAMLFLHLFQQTGHNSYNLLK